MCDEHYEEDLANYMRFPPLTRRQFGVLLGAGVEVRGLQQALDQAP